MLHHYNGGYLIGCTANTDKYATCAYVYNYNTGAWVKSARIGGSACWIQANDLTPGSYMAYFSIEDGTGRRLSTRYYNFTVD